jgi:hypothetical protein
MLYFFAKCEVVCMINIKKFLGLDYYTSPLDLFLALFRSKHPRASASQQAEIEKYNRIFQLRDGATLPEKRPEKLWDKF